MVMGIVEFYKGQNIFVTGATGFLGKALVEKILRFCPDVGNIYILIRPKKDKSPVERVHQLLENPLFDVLKRDNPESLKKIIPVVGDCIELGLGLSEYDRKLLQDNVSIVFHSAATVRFDEALKKAILLNVRGTRDLMTLLRGFKQLKVMLHISTMYCNCDRPEVDEMIYPPHADWKECITLAENYDEHILNIFTPKFLKNLPNTYLFTKSLSEHLVKDLGENLPTVIFRPTIVFGSYREPFPGWIDNLNGTLGLAVAGSYGIIRTFYGSRDSIMDHIPIDVSVNFMIIASWSKAMSGNYGEPSVYNNSFDNVKTLTTGEGMDIVNSLVHKYPSSIMLWEPNARPTANRLLYFFDTIFKHLIPAIIIDGLIKMLGYEPVLCRAHRRIYVTNALCATFLTKKWKFINNKCLALRSLVPPEDKEHFKHIFDLENIDVLAFFTHLALGVRRYLQKQTDDTIPKGRRLYVRMWWLDKICRIGVFILCLWLFYQTSWIHTIIACFMIALWFI